MRILDLGEDINNVFYFGVDVGIRKKFLKVLVFITFVNTSHIYVTELITRQKKKIQNKVFLSFILP